MSLHRYLRSDMVALEPDTIVRAAVRTLERDNIGAVVVQHAGLVIGIVTDRDLAIRVVGEGLDPNTATVGDVMTRNVATLSPSASQSDAIRLMYHRKIRRIPIVEHGQLMGMVTLDDLLLDEAAPPEHVAAVIQAQIGPGGPSASSEAIDRMRGVIADTIGAEPPKAPNADMA